jgi:hypothetical protein
VIVGRIRSVRPSPAVSRYLWRRKVSGEKRAGGRGLEVVVAMR